MKSKAADSFATCRGWCHKEYYSALPREMVLTAQFSGLLLDARLIVIAYPQAVMPVILSRHLGHWTKPISTWLSSHPTRTFAPTEAQETVTQYMDAMPCKTRVSSPRAIRNTRSTYLLIQACDTCHRRKVSCNGRSPCIRCQLRNDTCSYNRPDMRLRSNGSLTFTDSSKHQAVHHQLFEDQLVEDQLVEDQFAEDQLPEHQVIERQAVEMRSEPGLNCGSTSCSTGDLSPSTPCCSKDLPASDPKYSHWVVYQRCDSGILCYNGLEDPYLRCFTLDTLTSNRKTP
ncbi:hypothetical protein LY76DRAFT_380003 [Colletotrichum caudatum]|nr:hypothetical protein LY76DRAFT_380003 [Colletotrichum caudatum]